MLAAPNSSLMVGALGELTVRLAEAVPPAPPSVELIVLVVLFLVPDVEPVTFTAKVQEALAANVPPDRLTEPDPAAAVMVPVPQEPVSPLLGVATTRPVGKVSLKATPLSDAVALGLVTAKLRLVAPLSGMLSAPNDLVMVGGATTVTLAEAVPPEPPLPGQEQVTGPDVLFLTPAEVLVTFTEKAQEESPGRSAPDRLTELDPWVAVMVPVKQAAASPLGVDITRPAGRVSVKPTAGTASSTVSVRKKLSLVLPPNGICAAPNALLKEGAG
jgi:hypothetical protein